MNPPTPDMSQEASTRPSATRPFTLWGGSAAGSSGLAALEARLLTRRQMLRRMCAGFGMVGLGALLGPQSPLAAAGRRPHFTPRAKRGIFLFLNGRPAHGGTFDPQARLRK